LINQILIVITPDWNAVEGVLYLFEDKELKGKPIRVNVGKAGMGWGRGLHSLEGVKGPMKREGDKKSPAGLFKIGPAFGNNHLKNSLNIPFLLADPTLFCVDDPHSLHYNQFTRGKGDWTSAESMDHPLYSLGFVVQHNMHPTVPHAGSCIFFHKVGTWGEGTAGCTAMELKDLEEVVAFLDAQKEPLLVQLPQEEYALRQGAWDLPALTNKN